MGAIACAESFAGASAAAGRATAIGRASIECRRAVIDRAVHTSDSRTDDIGAPVQLQLLRTRNRDCVDGRNRERQLFRSAASGRGSLCRLQRKIALAAGDSFDLIGTKFTAVTAGERATRQCGQRSRPAITQYDLLGADRSAVVRTVLVQLKIWT
jgi:hypothetical protein